MEENHYKVDVSWDKDVLLITISGKATKQNASEMAKSVFGAQEELKPPKVLIDCTELEGRLSIIETYFHVKEYPKLKHPTKRAILDKPENREFFTFHETTSVNSGVKMKYFTDIDKALNWLNE